MSDYIRLIELMRVIARAEVVQSKLPGDGEMKAYWDAKIFRAVDQLRQSLERDDGQADVKTD